MIKLNNNSLEKKQQNKNNKMLKLMNKKKEHKRFLEASRKYNNIKKTNLKKINDNKKQILKYKIKNKNKNHDELINKLIKKNKDLKIEIGFWKRNKFGCRVKGLVGKSHPIINIIDLNKKFGSFQALKNISFKIMPKERVGIIGGNGAGKTTLSEIIAGISEPTTGQITYGFKYDEQPQEKIGIQFQDSIFPSGLSVKDIIIFARNVHKLKISNNKIKSLLKTFQMEEFYSRPSRLLSGGQRQKLNILLSVLHSPKLVVFDELSTGLDISAREDIITFADKLLEDNNMTAILVSHNIEEIRRLCNRVIVLNHGEIVAKGTIEEIEKEYKTLNIFMNKYINIKNKTEVDLTVL